MIFRGCTPIISAAAMRSLDNETKLFNTRNNGFGSYGEGSEAGAMTAIEAGYVLMKEAGAALFERVKEILGGRRDVIEANHSHVAVFVGGGNNGGDGLVLATRLIEEGIPCTVYSLAKPETFKNEARMAFEDFEANRGKLIYVNGNLPKAPHFDLVVDCMLGNGTSGELRPAFAQVVEAINSWGIPVLAADAPTGFDSLEHHRGEVCIKASETMLFGLPRLDAFTSEGSEVFGDVKVARLNYPLELIEKYDENFYMADEKLISKLLPMRNEAGDKRVQGTAMVIAGSGNMTGAAALSTEAALRSGAGLVTLAVPKAILPVMQAKLSEPVFCGLGNQYSELLSVSHIPLLRDKAEHQNAIAIGPGLGTAPETQDAVRVFLTGLNTPVVIDADAINACGATFFKTQEGPTNAIITPHKREWERNFSALPENENSYPEYLRKFSKQFNIVILLKGSPTYVALPDGKVFVIPARNSGMAKGGSGDVLTGIIVALLAQGLTTGDAAVLGALLHQKAGRLTRKDLGAYSMLPSDVIDHLHLAFG